MMLQLAYSLSLLQLQSSIIRQTPSNCRHQWRRVFNEKCKMLNLIVTKRCLQRIDRSFWKSDEHSLILAYMPALYTGTVFFRLQRSLIHLMTNLLTSCIVVVIIIIMQPTWGQLILFKFYRSLNNSIAIWVEVKVASPAINVTLTSNDIVVAYLITIGLVPFSGWINAGITML